MKNKYFLDTSYAIALVVENDQFHARAVDLSYELTENGGEIITTQAVLLEIGNCLVEGKILSISDRFTSTIRI